MLEDAPDALALFLSMIDGTESFGFCTNAGMCGAWTTGALLLAEERTPERVLVFAAAVGARLVVSLIICFWF